MVPRDDMGPLPWPLARTDTATGIPVVERVLDRQVIRTSTPDAEPESAASPRKEPKEDVPRIASTVGQTTPHVDPHASVRPDDPSASASRAPTDPTALAKKAIADCRERYSKIHDYTCTFHKRERIAGRLTAPHVMVMKVRTRPLSIYLKFQKPNRGREAIYIAGRHGGRVLAHDVGLGKLLAGTMHLDPRGEMAMEENLHPITEAGIGALIDGIATHWARELTPEESVVTIHPHVLVGNRPCTMIDSVHPRRRDDFLFHRVKLYIDREHGLPIRFESYDWPRHPGAAPELVEEYTYVNLRTNVGLGDLDFDPANAQYSFGRF